MLQSLGVPGMLLHLISQLDKATHSWDLQLQLLQTALVVLVPEPEGFQSPQASSS